MKKVLSAFILVLLCIPAALAIGIAPSRIVLEFEPSFEDTAEYIIKNSANRPITAKIYVKGELKDYVTLSEESARIGPNKLHSFTITLKLPETLDSGRHEARIGVSEIFDEKKEGGFAAVASVESQLWVDVPYEGKAIDVVFSATNPRVNDDSTFTLEVTSKGTETINEISGAITIFDPNGKEIDQLETDTISLPPSESRKIETTWTADVPAGIYSADAVVTYDGQTKDTDTTFRVGDLSMEIINVSMRPTRPGSIAKITTDVTSIWNEPINDVWAELEVHDITGATVGVAESKKITVEPWSNASIDLFWDTTGYAEGSYPSDITLHYAGKTDTAQFTIELQNQGNVLRWVLIGVIIILALYVLLWFVRSRRESHKTYK